MWALMMNGIVALDQNDRFRRVLAEASKQRSQISRGSKGQSHGVSRKSIHREKGVRRGRGRQAGLLAPPTFCEVVATLDPERTVPPARRRHCVENFVRRECRVDQIVDSTT